MPRTAPQTPNGAADIARRFGVTIKTLRLYEELGLIAPARTRVGWRQYDRADIEKLHMVLAFRQLGLPLAKIVQLAKGRAPDLALTLEVQAQALRAQMARAEESLALVALAKTALKEGRPVALGDLARLIRQAAEGRLHWTPELEALAGRVFTEDQRRRMVTTLAPEERLQREAAWGAIYEELGPLTREGQPDSPAAQDLAERAIVLIAAQTRNDPGTWEASRRFWETGLRDPDLRRQFPITPAQWDFLSAAITARLQARAERTTP
jgi:DNA-binding transcriptional MerR regulator